MGEPQDRLSNSGLPDRIHALIDKASAAAESAPDDALRSRLDWLVKVVTYASSVVDSVDATYVSAGMIGVLSTPVDTASAQLDAFHGDSDVSQIGRAHV